MLFCSFKATFVMREIASKREKLSHFKFAWIIAHSNAVCLGAMLFKRALIIAFNNHDDDDR